eukprot:3933687-Rhodomonas_salina.1
MSGTELVYGATAGLHATLPCPRFAPTPVCHATPCPVLTYRTVLRLLSRYATGTDLAYAAPFGTAAPCPGWPQRRVGCSTGKLRYLPMPCPVLTYDSRYLPMPCPVLTYESRYPPMSCPVLTYEPMLPTTRNL